MKKITMVMLVICLSIFIISCGRQKEELRVYSFRGEDEVMTVSDGVIVISAGGEIFRGGKLKIKEEYVQDIKSYETAFYFNKRDNLILKNSTTGENGTEIQIQSNLGVIRSENAQNTEWVKELSNQFFFELKITGLNGEIKGYQLPLVLEEITQKR